MKNGFTPWSEVVLEDTLRCERVACFALGCLEREHRLNVDALMAYWVRASLAWWTPLLPRHDHRARPLPPSGLMGPRSHQTRRD
jgi:hypothetical protein